MGITDMLLLSGFAGITVFIGGVLAWLFNHHVAETPVKYEITHTLMAFGGGILLSAVALVLVPKAMESLDVVALSVSFVLGALVFAALDWYLSRKGGKVANLLAMLMDFIPESLVLGAVFTMDASTATLLAVFIGLQNLPEAFNSYRDVVGSGYAPKKALWIFLGMSTFGVIGALLGYFYLSDAPDVTAHLMIFASGGILYLIFQDIAPQSKMKNVWFTSLGATLGFLVGIIGEKLI